MSLQVVNLAWSFVMRTDASGCAIGAVLEQAPRVEGMPTLADTASGKNCASGFHVKETDHVSGKDVEYQGQGGICSGVCIGEMG